jgi:hypothetical protein
MQNLQEITELWTRASVASKLGKWENAIRLWENIRFFYEKNPSISQRNLFVNECNTHINRARRFLNYKAAAKPHRETAAKPHREAVKIVSPEPKKCEQVPDSLIDRIMSSWSSVEYAYDEIQHSEAISPPPLQESFCVVADESSTEDTLKHLQSIIDVKNTQLLELQNKNRQTFNNLKSAMEQLTKQKSLSFAESLAKRYAFLLEFYESHPDKSQNSGKT